MNNLQARINKKIFIKKKTGTKYFEEVCFLLIKKTSLSYFDIVNAPAPWIMAMLRETQDYYKDKLKQQKKANKRR